MLEGPFFAIKNKIFSDKEGKIALSEKQKKRLKGWLRPEEIFETPTLVKCIDSGTIKQVRKIPSNDKE